MARLRCASPIGPAFAFLVLASPAMAAVSHLPDPILELGYSTDRDQVTLSDSDSSPSVTYTTDTEAEAAAVVAAGTASGCTWDMGDDVIDDKLVISYTVTGSGTLPSLGSINVLSYSGASLAMNATSRSFGSAAEAHEFGSALLAAKDLPSGSSLTEGGGKITLTIDLEETWITH